MYAGYANKLNNYHIYLYSSYDKVPSDTSKSLSISANETEAIEDVCEILFIPPTTKRWDNKLYNLFVWIQYSLDVMAHS